MVDNTPRQIDHRCQALSFNDESYRLTNRKQIFNVQWQWVEYEEKKYMPKIYEYCFPFSRMMSLLKSVFLTT